MSTLDQAIENQLKNIEKKTGKTLEELRAFVHGTGLTKHGEIRAAVMRDLGLSYGDANSLVHYALQSDGARSAQAAGASIGSITDDLYSGPKASLRPIHDRLMTEIEGFGPFEIVPKKGYLSLRRKKQFAMIGPANKTQVEVGLNMKGLPASGRLTEMRPGDMCQYKVKLANADEVDHEITGWIRHAYDSTG
ncbi:MAG: DUF5655 domain-containing protein [Chloroflexia bacterium]